MIEKILLAGDEADELGDAFLNGFLSIFGDFTISRESFFHDAADVSDRKETVLFTDVGTRTVFAAFVTTATRTRRSFGHIVGTLTW